MGDTSSHGAGTTGGRALPTGEAGTVGAGTAVGSGRKPTARAAPIPSASQALGRYGEDLAVQHLTAGGMAVLARNWRCAQGELDVVARDRDGTVVFVEVKTRAGTGFGEPAEAVGRVKARRLRVLACLWLLEHRPPGAPELRFDVVGVVRRRGEEPRVTHLRGAF